MAPIICVADAKGRVTLPGFANATVILEAVGPNEYRIRRSEAIAIDEVRFSEEEMPISLSQRDARLLIEVLENPPRPNAAARRAAKRLQSQFAAVVTPS